MVTRSLTQDGRDILSKMGIAMHEISPLQPQEGTHSLSAHDARFGDTWSKLRVFEMTEYDVPSFPHPCVCF